VGTKKSESARKEGFALCVSHRVKGQGREKESIDLILQRGSFKKTSDQVQKEGKKANPRGQRNFVEENRGNKARQDK